MEEYHGTIRDGKLLLPSMQKQLREQFLGSLRNGCKVKETITRESMTKTHKQVKTIFGLLIEKTIAQSSQEGHDTSGFLKLMVRDDLPSGVPLNKNLVYEILLALCPTYDEFHKRITLSKMNTLEAAQFFKSCTALLAGRGIYVPDPQKDWKEK